MARDNDLKNTGTHIDIMDGLRGIAIIMVLLFHVWQLSWFDHTIVLPGFRIDLNFIPATGFLGVELFFFISAFCLFYPYARHLFEGAGLQTVRRFAYRRAIKILPSYLLAILLIMFFFNPGFNSATDAVRQVVSHLLFIHNLFPETYGTINGVFWSLGVEVQFYILFPLICRLFRKRPLPVFLVMIAISIVYRSMIRIYYPDRLDFLLNQLPGFLDMFACGMLAAYAAVYIKARFRDYKRLAPFFTVFAIIMAAIVLYMLKWLYDIRYMPNGLKLWQLENRTYLAVVFLMLAVSSSMSLGFLKKILANRLFKFMSVISYNLYIWHQLIAKALYERKMPAPAAAGQHNDAVWKLEYTLLAIGIAIMFSTLVTYVFERPLLKKGIRGCMGAILRKVKLRGRADATLDLK